MRIASLGTGFGKMHAAIFKSIPGVEVAGIFGRDPQKTQQIARELGIQAFTHFNLLLQDPGLDAVDICLPTPLHAQYACLALQHGKHVFCETPAAYTKTDLEQMEQACLAANKQLLVALYARFNSEIRAIYDYRQDIVARRAVSLPAGAPPPSGEMD